MFYFHFLHTMEDFGCEEKFKSSHPLLFLENFASLSLYFFFVSSQLQSIGIQLFLLRLRFVGLKTFSMENHFP